MILMSKAKPRTTPADDWRQHQLRRRARGKGKHPLPGGRYSTMKRKLSGEVVARPALAALEELCILTTYSDGFTYTPQMEAACQHIADTSSPAAIAACLARASIRERAYVTASCAA
jgi:hypothetical protein